MRKTKQDDNLSNNEQNLFTPEVLTVMQYFWLFDLPISPILTTFERHFLRRWKLSTFYHQIYYLKTYSSIRNEIMCEEITQKPLNDSNIRYISTYRTLAIYISKCIFSNRMFL